MKVLAVLLVGSALLLQGCADGEARPEAVLAKSKAAVEAFSSYRYTSSDVSDGQRVTHGTWVAPDRLEIQSENGFRSIRIGTTTYSKSDDGWSVRTSHSSPRPSWFPDDLLDLTMAVEDLNGEAVYKVTGWRHTDLEGYYAPKGRVTYTFVIRQADYVLLETVVRVEQADRRDNPWSMTRSTVIFDHNAPLVVEAPLE